MIRPFALAAFLVFLFLPVSRAVAEISVAATLEWLADHCIESGVYRAAQVTSKAKAPSIHVVTFERMRSLRGKPQDRVSGDVSRESISQDSVSPDARKSESPGRVRVGDRFLLCFQHQGGEHSLLVHKINLSQPARRGFDSVAISGRLKLLRDGVAILRLFEARLRRSPLPKPVAVGDFSQDNRYEIEHAGEVMDAIYAGSTCFLKIPRDLTDRLP